MYDENEVFLAITCQNHTKFLPFTGKPKPIIMKRWLIGSLVGAIILFAWQALSWMLLPLHDGFAKYTPAQEEIMTTLSNSLTEDGQYMLKRAPDGSSMDEMEAVGKSMDGKPWALVMYKKSYEFGMARPMIRGFLIDFFLVFTLIYMLTRAGNPTNIRYIAGSVAAGLFAWMAGSYMAHNWFQIPFDIALADFVDQIVGFGLCGIWLGWFMNRPGKQPV